MHRPAHLRELAKSLSGLTAIHDIAAVGNEHDTAARQKTGMVVISSAVSYLLKACPIGTLMEETMAFAMAVNKRRPVVVEMKKRLNQAIVQAIDVEDVPYIESGQFNIG